MPSSWIPWIAALVIIAIVSVACRFAEEHPRADDPPDNDDEDRTPGPAVVPVAA